MRNSHDAAVPTAAAQQRRPFFEIEDIVVMGWALALSTAARSLIEGPGLARLFSPGPIALAVIGLAVCIVTRGPDDTSGLELEFRRAVLGIPGTLLVLVWMRGRETPFGCAGLIVAACALALFNTAVLKALHKNIERLPTLGRPLRRLLVTPAALLGIALFESQIQSNLLKSWLAQHLNPSWHLAAIGLVALLLYWSAVIGPRVLAGGPKDPRIWGPRFLCYLLVTFGTKGLSGDF
jgi:hypothetical protein